MSSFLRSLPTGLVALCLVASAAVPSRGARAQDSLDALMTRFRAVPGFRADFHESKRVALLRRPIETSGTLHFAPPMRFARHVTGPTWSSVVVDGTRLRLVSATEDRELAVSQSGGARPFLEGFVGLLAGDRAALERNFTVTFAPGAEWVLTLVPRAAGSIRSVTIRGSDVRIAGYRIMESSSDTTEVTLSGIDTRAYSSADAARAFRPHRP